MDKLDCYNCKYAKIRKFDEVKIDVVYCKEYDKIFVENEVQRKFVCVKHSRVSK